MVNQDTTQANKKLTTYFSNPWVGFIGSIASVVSILVAIFFYVQGKQERQLMFYVNPIKAVVVKSGQASRLSASFDNKVIKSDITASQVAIWNQGSLSIKKSNILKPIVIYTESNIPILEATIRKTSREVVQLTLNTDDLLSGKVTVSWNILEKNDGGIIQLIYAGDPSRNLLFDGVIEGQNKIRQLKFSGKIKSAHEQYTSNKRENLYSGIILFVIGISWLIVFFYIKIKRRRFRENLESRLKELENKDKSKLSSDEFRERELIKLDLKFGHRPDNFLFKWMDRHDDKIERILKVFLIITPYIALAIGLIFVFYLRDVGPPFGF